MTLSTWLRSLRSAACRPSENTRRRKPPRQSILLEHLEDRTVPAFVQEFPLPTPNVAPLGIITGPDGNLWFSEFNAPKIGRMTPQGTFSEFALPISLNQRAIPVPGPHGNLWLNVTTPNATGGAPTGIGRILEMTSAGTVVQDISLPEVGDALDLTLGPDGNLWLGDYYTGMIGRLTPTGQVTYFQGPYGIAEIVTGPDANLWFTATNFFLNSVGRITPAGEITVFSGFPGAPHTHRGLTPGPNDHLWMTTTGQGGTDANSIVEFDTNGQVVGVYHDADGPYSLTPGPDGNLWFTEHSGANIGRITPQGVITEFPIPTPNSTGGSITAGPDGNIWFDEYLANQIGRVVLNQPPALQSSDLHLSASTINEGDTVTLTGSFIDPGAPDTHTVLIDWGDSSAATTLNLAAGVLSFNAPHQYLDNPGPHPSAAGTYTIRVTVTDSQGASSGVSPDLVGWWRGEGNAADSARNNGGTLVGGVTFAPGRDGQAFQFDGVNGEVVIPDAPDQTPSSISFEGWVNPDSITGIRTILSKYHSWISNGVSWMFFSNEGRLRLGLFPPGHGFTTMRIMETDNIVLSTGTWQHVAATFDVDTQDMVLYVNGVAVPASFVNGFNATISSIEDTDTVIRIGSNRSSADGFWDGLLDELALYSRALTAQEVAADYAAGGTGTFSRPTIAVTVQNAAPTANVLGPTDGVRGQPRAFSLAASDPSPVDQAEGFSYTLDWGDGSLVQNIARTAGNGTGVASTHVYTASGTYNVTVTATDRDGFVSPPATHTITITAVALQPDPLAPGQTQLAIGGTTGDDHIQITPSGSTGDVEVRINSVSLGTFHPTSRVVAYAQAGDDDVQVASGVGWTAWLYGGDGNDRLKGGAGSNVLMGSAGDDLLVGGNNRDVLIGGTGADRIVGNAQDDVLIAGSTAFDGNEGALAAVLAEWTSTRSYAARVANLNGTGSGTDFADRLNGNVFLCVTSQQATTTVFDDGAADVLTGSSGQDWFFANLLGSGVLDRITDLGAAEFANDLTFIQGS